MTYLCSEFTDQVSAVQVNESIPDKLRHALNTGSMCPVRIMDRCESDGATLFISFNSELGKVTDLALQRGQQHMCGIQRMDKVRREGGGLLLWRDLGRSTWVGNINSLKCGHDLLFDGFSIGLYDR